MSAAEGGDDTQNTRPISVAELLARNGTIGAPPAGGHRRRRRGNSQSVSVSELTGEIPVIRDAPAVGEEVIEDRVVDEVVAEEAAVEEASDGQMTVEYVSDEQDGAAAVIVVDESVAEAGGVEAVGVEAVGVEAVGVEAEVAVVEDEPVAAVPDEPVVEEPVVEEPVVEEPVVEEIEAVRADATPPLSGDPLPRKGRGLELSRDPRPVRRGQGAEQMNFDPVDQSIDLADLVGEQDEDAEELRAYLQSSSGTLFGGETVADDLARRGATADSLDDVSDQVVDARPAVRGQGGTLAAVRNAVMAALQSVLAVAFGAGLFLGFDQLWRWNTIVALALSVLVILGLVVAVRVVRKTEDIASTLIAVAVGALVTLGPLALLQST